jgi:predicted Zn-dependent peptidase
MLALALSVALMSQDEPPRLRTICRNGAAVIVERMAEEPSISVQLWASSRGVPETPDSHGLRHLLEHLVAPGRARDLDRKLESAGGYLRATTYRDAMQFEIVVKPSHLDLALSAVGELLRPIEVDQSRIDREVAIMRQEFATYDDPSKLSRGAWEGAFGQEAMDPFGNLEIMAKATPATLLEIQRKHFYPENLVLSIAGPVDIKKATEASVEAIGMKQGALRIPSPRAQTGKATRIEVDGFGEARAAIVPGFDRPKTAGCLAFALAIASGIEGSFATYTPSADRGMVIVGQTEKLAGVGLKIDGVAESEMPKLYAIGKILARQWVQRYLRTSGGVAYIRGLMLVQNHASRPEQLLATIDNLSFAQFSEAARAFSKENCVVVVGS